MPALARYLSTIATAAVALLNGLPFSPIFDPVFFWIGRLAGRGLVNSPLVFHATTLVIMVVTLLLAGMPAYLLRRLMPRFVSSPIACATWLIAAIALSWPVFSVLLWPDE